MNIPLPILERLKSIPDNKSFSFTGKNELVYQEPIDVALSQYGEREVPGSVDNADIIQYAKELGITDYVHDEIPWCSLLMNWIMFKCGMTRTKTLAARDWLKVGKAVTDHPVIGDVVVFWRGSIDGWQGHVALFIREEGNLIYCLGGNQGDMVSIIGMPKDRLLAYRRMERI